MPEFVDGFILVDVVEVHKWFANALEAAKRLSQRANRVGRRTLAIQGQAVADEIQRAWDQYNADLRFAAIGAAELATKGMRDRLESTRRRPSRGGKKLADYVSAEALTGVGGLQTGAVGVGNVTQLKQAINPRGYGPYWRALEYGTGRGQVPSQIGRILYGSFTGPGGSNPTPPMGQYRGAGPHAMFVMGGVSGAGRTRGMGTISHEIAPKGFISRGSDEAAIAWRRAIAAAQERAMGAIKAAMSRLP